MEHSQFEGQLASKLHLENEADREPMMAARIGSPCPKLIVIEEK